jgi:tetratricopeptide (TPR) repeat protein
MFSINSPAIRTSKVIPGSWGCHPSCTAWRIHKGAVADYSEALRINPNFAVAYYHRRNIRYRLGDNQGAVADYNEAVRINPNFAEVYTHRGNARDDLGDSQGALADYDRASAN